VDFQEQLRVLATYLKTLTGAATSASDQALRKAFVDLVNACATKHAIFLAFQPLRMVLVPPPPWSCSCSADCIAATEFLTNPSALVWETRTSIGNASHIKPPGVFHSSIKK
jgi:hypothetical protein